MGEITKIKIFPSIGIMRVGNSPEFFIGPETPGVYEVPSGGFKDAQCRIKRQAACFRLYGYDDVGSKPVELLAQDVQQIVWRAQLGNKKSSWNCIFKKPTEEVLRNAWYSTDPAKREDLNIRAKERQLIGAKQAPVMFDDGKFIRFENGQFTKTEPIYLGEMWTDEAGRLLIVGGRGKSGGVVPQPDTVHGYPMVDGTYNTPGWYDDISDGPVKATVTLKTGKTIEALPSWVICAPPDFVPQMTNLTTLYDVLWQVAFDKAANNQWPPEVDTSVFKIPDQPSFKRDVAPILQRVLDLRWVNQDAAEGFAAFHGSLFAKASPPESDLFSRQQIFNALRPPGTDPQTGTMPKLWGDNYTGTHYPPENVMTPVQYEIIKRWASDNWKNPDDDLPPPASFTPEDLSRAALEACVGGAVVPGIEAGNFLRDAYDYVEPFRLDPQTLNADGKPLEAGDVTKQMSLPWQTDFFMCRAYEEMPVPLAWWPAQRPDEVRRDPASPALDFWTDGITTRKKTPKDLEDGRLQTVYDWHRFGFVVKDGDKFIETERCLVTPNIFLVLDRSHFSEHEVGKTPVSFDNCFYVVIEGFRPTDFKLEKEQLTDDELKALAPSVTLTRADGQMASGMEAQPHALLLEMKPLKQSALQRLTFAYRITFNDASEFADAGEKQITLTATKLNPKDTQNIFSASGEVTLFKQPNPYMLDGPVSWLSDDVRVFRVRASDTPFGIEFGTLEADTPEAGAKAARAFIKKVVDKFNEDQISEATHPFAFISKDQEESRLTLLEKIKSDGKTGGTERVFNFAIARVRYRSNVEAKDVRVFFRLFTTAATGLDYNETTYPRLPSKPVAIIGQQGGSILTIPCYGDARAASEEKQTDELNRNTLLPSDKGEAYCYFGCWLDFNQDVPQIPDPLNPSEKKSIQSQIKGMHQCLVAEIFYADDPIDEGATPAASDNLAQRNLLIAESDNPGSPATHTVQHTLELKATQGVSQQAAAYAALFANSNGAPNALAQPNELMIRWKNLPPGASITLYMPDVAAEVMKLAERNYDARRLERLGDGTIRCLPGDVTYVPLPTGRAENIAALLSVDLPDTVTQGEAFEVMAQQISGHPRRVTGAFQLNIPVSTRRVLLEQEVSKLSVLRYIFRSIPVTDRWYPVFVRYLGQVAERVRGFGGDPDKVVGAPDGSGVNPVAQRCLRFGWLVSLLLALLVLVAGLHPSANYLPEVIVAALLIVALVFWATKCQPSACRALTVGLVGVGLGAALLAVFLLAGFTAPHGLVVIALAALAFGALALAGLLSGCLSFADET